MTEVVNAYMDGNRVVFLSRDESGHLKPFYRRAEWTFYLRRADVDTELERQLKTSHYVVGVQDEGDWFRVSMRDWEARRVMLERVLVSIPTYEGDVHPIRRAITDNQFKIQKPLYCFSDLETDSRVRFSEKERMRILSYAVVAPDGTRLVETLREDSDHAERELLERYFEVLSKFDLVAMWNGKEFDEVVLQARIEHTHARCDMRHKLWLDQMLLFKRMNSAESGDEKQSFSINAIGHALLGEGKDMFDASKTWQAWAAGGEERERLARYNLRDTELQLKIDEATGFMALFNALAMVTNVFPETRGLNPTGQMDGFMFRIGKERGVHYPTKKFGYRGENEYEGAYVQEPPEKAGILHDVHVADFASLYPSVILTFNMSPETKVGFISEHVKGDIAPVPHDKSETVAVSVTGCGFRTDVDGILCVAVREMLEKRKEWSAKQASFAPGTHEWHDAGRISTAYKVAVNAFYGVLGSEFSRYYDRDIAESVTLGGQWLLRITRAASEAKGYEVIYQDTDSLFEQGCSRTEFDSFVKWCNTDLYPSEVAARGCVGNWVKLAYEKQFARIVFTAGKRYCGIYSHYKGKDATSDSKPEIKGLEYKRGDAAVLARKLQGELIGLFTRGELNVTEYRKTADAALEHIMNDSLPLDEICLTKAMNKPIAQYGLQRADGSEGSIPVHVHVAKELIRRGKELGEGSRVSYVVVDASESPIRAIPVEDYDEQADRYYLWDSLVYPASQRLLQSMFPEHDWRTGLENLRPKKIKTKNPNQLSFFSEATTVANDFFVDVPEAIGERGIALLKELFVANPGPKRAMLRIALQSGAIAVLATNLHTTGNARLMQKAQLAIWEDRMTVDFQRELVF